MLHATKIILEILLLRNIIENIITKDCKQSVQITAFIPPDMVYITALMDLVFPYDRTRDHKHLVGPNNLLTLILYF